MKLIKFLPLLVGVLFWGISSHAQSDQDKLNLPGDNLNLYAVMKLFQESETLEIFEKKLNEEDSKVNNLDLNGDNQIDYIRVIDDVDGNVHNIVLRVAISPTENQDVAVFVVQKTKNNEVQIQLIGDEDLYGKNYIIEPNFETADNNSGATPNPGYTGGENQQVAVVPTTTYEIASWPVVEYIYVPTYTIWISPWYWGYYPSYWHPWQPYYWHYYWGYQYHWNYYYHSHYRHWYYNRYNNWNGFYYGERRARSNVYQERRVRGDFNTTYSRPEMARQGSENFRTRFPKAPSANDRLPDLNKPTGRPSINKPSRDKPVLDRPIQNRPQKDKPILEKPVQNRPQKDKPVIDRPVQNKPIQNNRPVIKPQNRPVMRPNNTRPNEIIKPNGNKRPSRNPDKVKQEGTISKPGRR